ncbi:MAG: Rrf2 family transcriptional regulator [Betaproteobacteria bacterium]|jgi:Rrf2 family iron-sulfur cluster assembly transcriptional regulator
MRMSTKGRVAVAALIDLALHAPRGPVSLGSISKRQQVSLSYLEQLFSHLRREGLVESARGPGGGYRLGRAAQEISVGQIVSAVDDPVEDLGPERTGESASTDLSRDLWRQLHDVMLRHMSTITLASLAQEQIDKGVKIESPPHRLGISAIPVVKPMRTRAPNSVFALASSMAA